MLKPKHRLLLMAAGAFGLVLLGATVAGVVLLSGAYDTAATTQHFRITHRLLDAGLRYSVRTASAEIEVPPLDRPGMLERGASCYRDHCVQCHGAPSIPPDDAGKGQLPIASNLAQSGREWPPQWLYYVVKKGVRMTGMPAWEFRISDDGLWSTVTFLQQLPTLTGPQYLALDARARSATCPPATEIPQDPPPDYPKIVLRQYACDSCHIIEGVVGPHSYSGPPLVDWSRRKYIAGVLPNTRKNLTRWIRHPQEVSPGTLMPDLQVSEAHARVMTDYLFNPE